MSTVGAALFESRRISLLFHLFRLLHQSILGSIPDGRFLNRQLLIANLNSWELALRWNVFGVDISGASGGGEKQQEKIIYEHLVFLLLDGIKRRGNECKKECQELLKKAQHDVRAFYFQRATKFLESDL